MGRNLKLVEKFIESKGGCNDFNADLFDEFKNSGKELKINKNTLKAINKKQFELALFRICKHTNGKIEYDNGRDKCNNRRRYIITVQKVVSTPQGIEGEVSISQISENTKVCIKKEENK